MVRPKSYAEIVQGAHRDPPSLKVDIWSLLMVLASEYDFKKVPPQRVQRQIHGAGASAAGQGGVGAGPVARVTLALDLAAGIAAAILCLNPREHDSSSSEGLPHYLKLAPASEVLSMTASVEKEARSGPTARRQQRTPSGMSSRTRHTAQR